MPIVESRNKTGTLTLDALPFQSQATNVTLEPSVDAEGDRLEVLSGDTIEPDEVESWTLNIEAVQDFDDPAGFVKFAKDNAGEIVPFTWAPTGATGPEYAGSVRVRAVRIGGDVNARLTTPAEWPVVGAVTDTYPV
jgi:hypothetical protein